MHVRRPLARLTLAAALILAPCGVILAQPTTGTIAPSAFPQQLTVAKLPAANGRQGVRVVTDALSTASCTVAGGTTKLLCLDNGAWTPVGSAAVAAPGVSIVDAGNFFTGTDVEAALQEIGAGTALDGRYLRRDGRDSIIPNGQDSLLILPSNQAHTLNQLLVDATHDGSGVFASAGNDFDHVASFQLFPDGRVIFDSSADAGYIQLSPAAHTFLIGGDGTFTYDGVQVETETTADARYSLLAHTHLLADVADVTASGVALATAADAVAQRTALGLGTAAVKDVPASGNASSSQVVKGDDTRLSDARALSGSAGGDLAGTYPNPTVAKLNGTSLAGLGTGILKNTTGTGVPSIAVAGDFPPLNQNTNGTAAGLSSTLDIAHGGLNLTTAADDTVPVGNGAAYQAKTLPDCVDSAGNHLNYTAASNAFSCGTSSSAGGGGGVSLQGATPGTPDTGNINVSGAAVFGGQVKAPAGTEAAPGVQVGEVGTGFSLFAGGGRVMFDIGGVNVWDCNGNRCAFGKRIDINVNGVGDGPSLGNAPSATDPSYAPSFTDSGTGVGHAATGRLTLISGNVEALETTVGGGIRQPCQSHPPVACSSSTEAATYYDCEDHDFCDCKGSAPAWASRSVTGNCT